MHGTKPGPQPYLNDKEERELGLFLKDCAAVGYGKTRMDVMSIAQSVAEEKGILHGSKTKKVASKGKGAVRKGKEKAITKPMETVASSSSDTPNTFDNSVLQPLKKRRLQMSEEIDLNECCMCFGTYEDDIMEGAGAEWISCACGRWLHEDCAENRVIDSSGCERFCHYCVC